MLYFLIELNQCTLYLSNEIPCNEDTPTHTTGGVSLSLCPGVASNIFMATIASSFLLLQCYI